MQDITRKMLEDRLSIEKRELLDVDFNINRLQNNLSDENQRKNKIVKTIEALEKDLNK